MPRLLLFRNKSVLPLREFVINIISEWFVEAANHCCGNFEYGEDEMELSGLTPMPSVKASRCPPPARASPRRAATCRSAV